MRPVTRKPLIVIGAISGLIVGCQQAVPPPIKAANGFLKSTGSVNEWRCLKELASENDLKRPLVEWEIKSIQERIDQDDPDATYYEVHAELTTLTKRDFTVTNTWVLSVWESEELFEMQKRMTADILEFVEKAEQLTGENYTEEDQDKEIFPKRTDITEKSYCVTNMKRLSKF